MNTKASRCMSASALVFALSCSEPIFAQPIDIPGTNNTTIEFPNPKDERPPAQIPPGPHSPAKMLSCGYNTTTISASRKGLFRSTQQEAIASAREMIDAVRSEALANARRWLAIPCPNNCIATSSRLGDPASNVAVNAVMDPDRTNGFVATLTVYYYPSKTCASPVKQRQP